MTEEKEYRVLMHKFIGYDKTGAATYEITFNKSLEHTGRFKGIENGLNAYVNIEKAVKQSSVVIPIIEDKPKCKHDKTTFNDFGIHKCSGCKKLFF